MSLAMVEVDVSNVSQYPIMPDLDLTKLFFPSDTFFINEYTAAPGVQVAVSFDAIHDHLVLTSGTPGAGMRLFKPPRKIWVRRYSALGPSPIIVRITATDGSSA